MLTESQAEHELRQGHIVLHEIHELSMQEPVEARPKKAKR